MGDGPSAGWFVAVALGFALLLSAAGYLVLVVFLGQEMDWVVTAVTAFVVGAFAALTLLGRRSREVQGGFEVVERRVK